MTKATIHKPTLVATREAYGQALVALGQKYPELVVMDVGMSNSTYSEMFAKSFPKRYFPMFIAEQNAIGVAVGLAKRGFVPFVSTFAAFWSRAHDQIRMASYSQANIKICGSHCGLSAGPDGISQMGLEDLAMFRSVYGSTVLYPADKISTSQLMSLAYPASGIVYLRTSKIATPIIYSQQTKLTIPGFAVLKQSPQDKVAVIGAGITVHEALTSYQELQKQEINIRLIDLYCLKPINQQVLVEALGGIKQVITVEDHYPEGGLGEAVRGAISNSQINITSLAVTKLPKSGQPQELLAYAGIDHQAIIKAVKSLL